MKTKFGFWIIILVTIFSQSCSDDWYDINNDPNNPQKVDAHLLLPPMLYAMSEGEVFDYRYTGKFVGHIGRYYKGHDYDRFGEPSKVSGTQKFRNHYWGIGRNVDAMIEDATAKGAWDYAGVATAIRAWSWLITTDHHGPMIFEQAWDDARLKFDYDTQKEIYQGVRDLCAEALEYFDKVDSEGTIEGYLAEGDLMYNGDINKWRKFVYSVLARVENHMSRKSSYDADLVIQYANAGIQSDADVAYVQYDGESSNHSSFWGPTRSNMKYLRPTQFFIDLLNGTAFNGISDPRLPQMWKPSADGVFRGVVDALGDLNRYDDDKKIPTQYGNVWSNDTEPYALMSYAEMEFIKAEAYFYKGDKAAALAAMKSGILAHMVQLEVDAADADTFVNSAALPDAANLELKHIMSQKHIAMFLMTESWVDMRRHHYDPNVYIGFTVPEVGLESTNLWEKNQGALPYRWWPRQYSEYDWNKEAIETIGGNDENYPTYPVWFAVDDEEDKIEPYAPLPIIR